MREQYLAQVKYKGYNSGKWDNAMFHYTGDANSPGRRHTGGARYAKTREEAEAAIEYCKRRFTAGEESVAIVESIGVSSVTDSRTVDTFTVVESRILVRPVGDWEEVSYQSVQ